MAVNGRAVSRLDPTGTVVITLASSLADNHAALRRLAQVLLIIGGAVLVVLAGLTYLVVLRSLRPLTEVEHTAVAIATGDLDRRVPEGNTGSEVGRLALALNGMLSQIQTAFQTTAASAAHARRAEVASALAEEQATDSEQKMHRFIGDASHELRTPLTIIRGFAELYRQSLGQSAGVDPTAVARMMSRIEGEAQRMGLLVEDLLLLARLDAQRPLEHHQVDLLHLATDALHDARMRAPGRTVEMEIIQGPSPGGRDAPRRLDRAPVAGLTRCHGSGDTTIWVGMVGAGPLLERWRCWPDRGLGGAVADPGFHLVGSTGHLCRCWLPHRRIHDRRG